VIWNELEFHNVAELEEIRGLPGLKLHRFPKELRDGLGKGANQRGRLISHASTGCEIRFVTEAEFVRVTLSAVAEDGDVIVYNGDYFHSMHRLKAGVIQALHLDKPARFADVQPEALRQGRFSPAVWRIVVSRNYYPGPFQAAFHHVETFGHEIRPPRQEELPARRLLAYGSSITHGSGATVQHQAYIQQTARRLGADVMNKGIGGACLCEPAMADYLMHLGGWDIATLELGVNMRGMFTADEFEERARYLVQGMLEHNPGKPVMLISIYPNSADVLKNPDSPGAENNRMFVERLQKIHQSLNHPCLHYVDGHTILTDFSALAVDLIHPSDYGHTLMGQNLAEAIRKVLE
jgi:lysophospholipase L1-like esterase